ncbi:MAG TPA: DedA family protein [Actinocrinis sp.]|nr:DedA family protein [Actinocrinis sp.]
MNPFSATSLLTGLGPYAAAGILLVLFIETALPIGFVLPGDTLLLTAGLLCATGHLSLPWVLAAAAAGAIAGAQTGYLIGRIGERQLPLRHRNSRIERAMTRIEHLATRRGPGPALLAARFIPGARSLMGPLAGVLNLPLRAFVAWQVIGALAWTLTTTLAGYAAGRAAPGLEHYLPEFLAAAVLSLPLALACGYARTRIRAHHRTT